MKKLLARALLPIVLSGYAMASPAAGCKTLSSPGTMSFSFPNIVVTGKEQNGHVFAEVIRNEFLSYGIVVECDNILLEVPKWGNEAGAGEFQFPGPLGSTAVTTVPGIGLQVDTFSPFMTDSAQVRYSTAPPCARSTNPETYSYCGGNWGGLTFRLVKTGPISAGTLFPGLNSVVEATVQAVASPSYLIATYRINSSEVSVRTCSVSAPSSIPLGSVNKHRFPGKDKPYPQEEAFDLTLTACDPSNMQVNVRLEGVIDSQPDVLKLVRPNSGVGIQVLNRNTNTPILFNQDVVIGNTHSAAGFTIPLAARYFQLGTTVVPGEARAVAQYTITYK